MEPGFLKNEESSAGFKDPTKYRSLVGGLLYLACNTRPDVAACTAILGRKFSDPTEADWTAAKRVLRYLKKTVNYSLRLGGDLRQPLVGYSDSDWAGDVNSRKSTSGFVFFHGGALISWASRLQTSIALSSMEAEYLALSEGCQETVWLRQLLCDFGEEQETPTVVNEDNQGCIAFVRTERCNRRSKHIDTREKFVKNLCEKKVIELRYCSTDQMIADVMTKPLGPSKHQQFCEMMGLGDWNEPDGH
ncbi:uncharacterized protein LOC129716564 [Wyeomyia smithii]|uniref:uncharacterized protein LOC129716564 n=1 Tax=Wyeomyia smithii TaxID=174621 RepID=UPI002468151E|nr:uncharacterized protein LOC129716564 [Wyeomyia smithii]